MKWPWHRVAEAREAAEQAETNRLRIQSMWPYIHAEVERARDHQRNNHFIDIIQRVAGGRSE